MILSPNLDDRKYQDIVNEAIRLIPHYCPEWTNHNPTDPGVTLIELFAWMTEMMIYRLNKVPEKNYFAFLDLIGLTMTPPQPSRVLLTFDTVSRYEDEIIVKRGTPVSTKKLETSDAIVFETEKDLSVANIQLASCVSTHNGLVTENILSNDADLSNEGFSLFSGNEEIERYIYLSDNAISYLAENNSLNIVFNNANEIKSSTDEIVNFLEWEYWNGKRWTAIEYSRAIPGIRKKEDNSIFLSGPIEIEETEINNIEGFYVRAKLTNIPERDICYEINNIVLRLIFHGEGLSPELCLSNTDNGVYHILDLNKDFTPFVETPKYNDAFYIASLETFSKEDSEIFINFHLNESEKHKNVEASEDLVLKYEYWNGRNWRELGSTTSKGVKDATGEFKFADSTNAFTKSGEVKFLRPVDMKETIVNNTENLWIRIRISAGDFGTGGSYVQDDDGKWNWVYDRPINPPLLSHIRLRYLATNKPVKNILSYYDFSYFNFSNKNNENYQLECEDEAAEIKYFNIFEINKETCPITYFGFDREFPVSDNFGMYFRVNERKKIKPARNSSLPESNKLLPKPGKRNVTLKWEYWCNDQWKSLSVDDYTDNYHESGFIEFRPPQEISLKNEFGKKLFWIRLIYQSGSFENDPKIINIKLNSVFANNQQTYRNELLGSSSGSPAQEFELLHSPLLPGLEVIVRENELPPMNERKTLIDEEGEDAIVIKRNSNNNEEYWIRYHQVENFHNSNASSRHYCLDYNKNTIVFGDGKNGTIPPRMKNNIVAAKYQIGGGSQGNVGAYTVNLLRENIPFISEVNNFYAAEGGSDLEKIDDLKSRATNVFKNLNRAVTSEDYEWLAREASASVARAKCLSDAGKNGEVILVVLPKPELDDFDLSRKLYPTSELLRRVKEYLNARKLVGSKLKVESPVYVNIDINLKLVFKKEISEVHLLKEKVVSTLRRYLHPITGGLEGDGWKFGVPLSKNDIFNIVEKVDGVYYIEEIEIVNNDAEVAVEKLLLDEDSLIFVENINISERKNQY